MTRANPTVLIAEDDATLRSAYETVLTIEGYRVLAAADGEEALAIASKETVDVVLLDMLIPNMNGLEFLEAYKATTEHPDTKIIIFSNMSVPRDVMMAKKLGASRYLTKSSFTPKEMTAIIKEALTKE